MSLLIKNGRVITAVDDYFADIFIENDNEYKLLAQQGRHR